LVFNEFKSSIEAYLRKYTQDNPPPPCQIYTLTPNAGAGNHHLVQKTFEGEFEFDILYSADGSGEAVTCKHTFLSGIY
jgi:mannosyl-oligosaccharide glucosidase